MSIGWDGSSVNVNAQRRRVKVMNMDRSAMYMPGKGEKGQRESKR